MANEEILIPKTGGGTLCGVRYFKTAEITSNPDKSPDLPPFVILCHGFTGDKYEWGRFTKTCDRLLEEGFDSVIFDFSGSGKNPREHITLSKQIQDLIDVYAWAHDLGYSWISTIGLSFGGLTSLIADLPERKCAIFWAPAFFFMDIMGRKEKLLIKVIYSILNPTIKQKSMNNAPVLINKGFFSELSKLDIIPILENFNTPCLIVQGVDDSVVKVEKTRIAFKHLPDDINKKMVEIDNATHDFSGEQLEQFITQSIRFLKAKR